jgi:serine/threonine protein kinase
MLQLANNIELQQGKYKIIRVLGQGGFGITYLANHTLLDKYVAIKEFFPKEYCDRTDGTSQLSIGTKNSIEIVDALKAKFVKEARNISKLHHPNIITIHDIFLENNTAYYVMEYIEGASLWDIIEQRGRFDENSAVQYIKKIAKTVDYMHSQYMNHLDIKPANIMIRKSDGEPILIDFGLSKQYDVSGGQTSTTPVGISHGYAPIEQYRPGGVTTFTPQTDVYALGATLYVLITGKTPPHYSFILEDGFPDMSAIASKSVINAIKAAMEIKKSNRPANINEWLRLLGENNINLNNSHDKENLSNEHSQDGCQTQSKIEERSIDLSNNSQLRNGQNADSGQIDNSSIEETVILNVTKIADALNGDHVAHEKVVQIDESDNSFIDLGLSVCWAKQTSGVAKTSYNSDVYKFILNNGDTVSPHDFENVNSLPSMNDFEELLERCSWTPFSDKDVNGYKIVGPNGNILIMPLSAINRYLSRECLKPNCAYYYSLYLGEYTHTLAKSVPTDANIWTIRRKG